MEIVYLSEWFDSLLWCPSQLTRKFKDPNTGDEKELYCRWRHNDPWTFEIIQEDSWVSLGGGLTQDDEIKDVHKFAERLLFKYFGMSHFKVGVKQEKNNE